MEFIQKQKKTVQNSDEFKELEKLYPHSITLYQHAPKHEISLSELKEITAERLLLLRTVERTTIKCSKFLSDEWKTLFFNELTRKGLKYYVRLIQYIPSGGNQLTESDLHARRKDQISHYMLRLSYCATEELREWFWQRERELFRVKFSYLTVRRDFTEFLQYNHLDYQPISEDEKCTIKNGLYASTIGQSITKIESIDFYKIHFTEVLDLIRARRCFVQHGFAYVGSHDFQSIILARLYANIRSGLNSAFEFLPVIQNDERIYRLITSLLKSSNNTGEYRLSANGVIVPIESLDILSKKSFPLCMRDCHEQLRKNHHLKYTGRLQYSLFLKGIGLQMEDCIKYWHDEFTKVIDEKRWKEHEYLIQHSYGKRGSMRDYKPHSCTTIIQHNSGGGFDQSVQGCPYRTLETSALRKKLTGLGLSIAHSQEVIEYASKGHYNIACGRYFEITHQEKMDIGIQHPNQYFDLSQSIIEKRTSQQPQNQSTSTTATATAPSQSSSVTINKNQATEIALKKVKPSNDTIDIENEDLWDNMDFLDSQATDAFNF